MPLRSQAVLAHSAPLPRPLGVASGSLVPLIFVVLSAIAILLPLLFVCFGQRYARTRLAMKASIWRGLMSVGMKIHHYADPKPPRPSFKIFIPSRLSSSPGMFKLLFYVPEGYYSDDPGDDYRWPFVVNFHGGGFTLGTGTDDARWAAAVIRNAEAVLVSVEYRLAPEYPFSVGVEDGTDALIYLAAHAEELRLDPHRIALSGFSAGANFALTIPLILHDLREDRGRRSLTCDAPSKKSWTMRRMTSHHDMHKLYSQRPDSLSRMATAQSLRAGLPANFSTVSVPSERPPKMLSQDSTSTILKLTDLEPTILEMEQRVPDLTIKCLVSFYPPTDFRIERAAKRVTNPCPEKNLPSMLTDLFDQSYIQGTNTPVDLSDPYLSPAAADDALLRDAYPQDIVLYTCEYDMLNAEGVAFGERLKTRAINKTVHGGLVKASVHGFDKKPNPLSFPVSADRCYSEACAELKRLFGGTSSFEERRQLDEVEDVDRFDEGEVRVVALDEDGEERERSAAKVHADMLSGRAIRQRQR